jgi:hypothetical protein
MLEILVLEASCMHVTLKRPFLIGILVLLFACLGFACGWLARNHMQVAQPAETRKLYLQQPGDAPPEVRSGVILALKELQDGYRKRNVNNLDAFMNRLFVKDKDLLILGTDGGEWVRGYSRATELIRLDWTIWGDVRFAVDDAIVWSSGDTAWMATVGEVQWKRGARPMRLSGILVRKGDRWMFRQLQYQWDDQDPQFKDLFKPQSDLRALHGLFPGTAHPLEY